MAGSIVKVLFISTTLTEAWTAVRFIFLKNCWVLSQNLGYAARGLVPVLFVWVGSGGLLVCLALPLFTRDPAPGWTTSRNSSVPLGGHLTFPRFYDKVLPVLLKSGNLSPH